MSLPVLMREGSKKQSRKNNKPGKRRNYFPEQILSISVCFEHD